MIDLGGSGYLDATSYAVRWARREVRHEMDYTRWHWTADSHFTLCGQPIRLANDGGTFLPDTDTEQWRVDCYYCLKALARLSSEPPDATP